MSPFSPFSGSAARRAAGIAAAATLLIIVAAGCGGSSPSTSSGSQGENGPAASAFKLSACMRAHGVADFPDPKVTTTGGGTAIRMAVSSVIAGSPHFKSAQAACQKLVPPPNGGGPDGSPAQRRAREQALVAFSQCLRGHGFPSFPDPTAHGDISPAMLSAAGINLHTPALLGAAKGCTSVTHGQITPAQVVQAINGPH